MGEIMDKKIEKKIIKGVHDREEEIKNFLIDLIQINSQTGKEAEIQGYLAEAAHQMGLSVDKWDPNIKELQDMPGYIPVKNIDFNGRPNVVATYKGNGKGRSLILNGHVDTITVEPIDDWDDGPFSGMEKEGLIYGRGASDMKSGVAAMTMAVKLLLDLELRPSGSIFLEYVVDEEVTGYGTLSTIARGYKADAGICCETSDLNIQPACIGRLWFTIDIRGKTSSIANRRKGISAIEKAIKIINAVEDYQQKRLIDLSHPLFEDKRAALPCMVCMIDSGTFPSVIPDRALLKGSMGLLPHEKVKEVKSDFQTHLNHIAKADPWLRNHPPRVTFKDIGADGAEIPKEHPIVDTVRKAYKRGTGNQPSINGRAGGSDTRYLIKYGNTPTVIFGPGTTSQMHAMNEYVPTNNLIDATKTLALAIYEWCQ